MIRRFHGIDRHRRSSTVSVLNREGVEEKLISSIGDLDGYIKTLRSEDAVVMETGAGSFYWADKIEARGAQCFIIDPYRFRIIKDSWNKTDKRDSRNMSKALWVYMVTGEFGLPTVYKPSVLIRELRKLYAQYQVLNKQIRVFKNNIQSVLADNGVVLPILQKNHLLSEKRGKDVLEELDISEASRISIKMNQEILWCVLEKKEELVKEILRIGEPLKEDVELLISIRGITPLTSLAFLADVADIHRFKTVRKMNSYLGLVPKLRESGSRSHSGHINRASRKLTRTILTQSLIHITDASFDFRYYYDELKSRRGAGRARIALIRKLCGIMRRMLLNKEEFRHIKLALYEKKRKDYKRQLMQIKEEMERKSA